MQEESPQSENSCDHYDSFTGTLTELPLDGTQRVAQELVVKLPAQRKPDHDSVPYSSATYSYMPMGFYNDTQNQQLMMTASGDAENLRRSDLYSTPPPTPEMYIVPNSRGTVDSHSETSGSSYDDHLEMKRATCNGYNPQQLHQNQRPIQRFPSNDFLPNLDESNETHLEHKNTKGARKQGKRSTRTNYTNEQLYALERQFQLNQYPDAATLDELSKEIDLATGKIRIWFQNKRAKWRRGNKESKVQIENDLSQQHSEHVSPSIVPNRPTPDMAPCDLTGRKPSPPSQESTALKTDSNPQSFAAKNVTIPQIEHSASIDIFQQVPKHRHRETPEIPDRHLHMPSSKNTMSLPPFAEDLSNKSTEQQQVKRELSPNSLQQATVSNPSHNEDSKKAPIIAPKSEPVEEDSDEEPIATSLPYQFQYGQVANSDAMSSFPPHAQYGYFPPFHPMLHGASAQMSYHNFYQNFHPAYAGLHMGYHAGQFPHEYDQTHTQSKDQSSAVPSVTSRTPSPNNSDSHSSSPHEQSPVGSHHSPVPESSSDRESDSPPETEEAQPYLHMYPPYLPYSNPYGMQQQFAF